MTPARSGRDLAVAAVATTFLRRRPLIVAPAVTTLLLTLHREGAPRAQLVALGSGMALMLLYFTREAILGRTRTFDDRALLRSLVITLVGIAAATFGSGALESPVLPLVFAPSGVGFAAFGRGRASTVLLGLLLLVVGALALASGHIPFPPLDPDARRVPLVVTIVTTALLLRVGVAPLTEAHRRRALQAMTASDEVLAAARARTGVLDAAFARVAHEIRNPLTAIRTLVEVMRERAEAADRRRLDVAVGEVERIETILTQYLSLARPFRELARAPRDAGELVDQMVTILEPAAETRGVELTLAKTSLVLGIDADRFKEATLNLLVNALEATAPGGHIAVRVGTEAGELVLTVTDTGRGMAAEMLAKLGTAGVTGREEGTGLGVGLARQVAEAHGGRLDYESVEGRGTTATMRIPR